MFGFNKYNNSKMPPQNCIFSFHAAENKLERLLSSSQNIDAERALLTFNT
jgi:hypothetical protein